MTGVTKKDAERMLEKQMEAERMHDVLLLLQNLSNDQEATIKLIIDCLYDAGAVNLINQKIQFRPLNRMTKSVARISKPVFRNIAWYWFRRNCPQLIVNWLLIKITFQPQRVAVALAEDRPEPLVENEPRPVSQNEPRYLERDLSRVETLDRENRQLRHRVRLLTGVSVLAIAALGIAVTIPHRTLEIFPSRKQQPGASAKVSSSTGVTLERACLTSRLTNCDFSPSIQFAGKVSPHSLSPIAETTSFQQ
ncbi:hypothetical protein H6G17_25240 [Chroococcidiopsis sp. FACHB-1243]|uniref:hypothetical protein n=1 Tax=Chroococcidiopsis sp. [FACHB-1243] TaxID=2692781 RepID=UPI00177AD48F|nr:hypothetical protein [Chroococcidiopsis sp. [FACHB-1243]]MBD2308779.1 hypothetical protein [Chroococcidiopsis sp. [FACHB-1243]]